MADYSTLSRSPSRPASIRSARSSARQEASSHTSEQTPLLSRREDEDYNDREESPALSERPRSRASDHYESIQPKVGILTRRWPSVLALLLLFAFTVLIMLVGFFVPEVIEEYAIQAKQFELTSVSLPEFTASGAKARVQGVFWMDPSEVKRKSVRDLGVFGTWIAGAVNSGESTVKVRLPDYGNVLLGTAVVPPVKVDIRANKKTYIDFLADLEPGDVTGIRKVADDYVGGRLSQLKVSGEAVVKLRSGIFSLGTQSIVQTLVLAGNDIPAIPAYNITKLMFHEIKFPDGKKAMEADVSVWVKNDYPVDFAVPPLDFGILVDNCLPDQPRILVADAHTPRLPIRPRVDLNVNVSGTVQHLPNELISICPGSGKSPLDVFLGDYINGEDTTIYIRGSDSASAATPKWLSELLSSITVPIPFKGHTFENLIRNFSLADVHFSMPDPFAEPDSPDANPQISAMIKAYINIPGEMNFPIDVNHVRANANVLYKGKKLGFLDLNKWQDANSTLVPPSETEGPALLVESAIKQAPLEITDQDVFSQVVQKMLFGGKGVKLAIKADVDVEMETALGVMTVREIPAEGVVPIKPISSDGGDELTNGFSPKVGNLEIVSTTEKSLIIQAEVNFTNPTNYSATVPFVDISIEKNGSTIGHAQVQDAKFVPGKNKNIVVRATWEPEVVGGEKGAQIGRELLSQYISGYNTTLTFHTNRDSIPHHPLLGEALSKMNITIQAPHLSSPKPGSPGDEEPEEPENPSDPDDDKGPHFITSATMHLLSSTAVFTLLSPFRNTTLYITSINATAFYQPDDPAIRESEIGKIVYDGSFAVTPGESESPRLPVAWDLGSVGYEAARKALGGSLKLRAEAEVGVRIGLCEQKLWFHGQGIGSKVRL